MVELLVGHRAKILLGMIIHSHDSLVAPLVFLAARLLRWIRQRGLNRMPKCRKALLKAGCIPVVNHYYEPLIDVESIREKLDVDRPLPGIKLRERRQLQFIMSLQGTDELLDLSSQPSDEYGFHFNNGRFEAGDAEIWYQVVRTIKPHYIIEIGSGYSTRLAVSALRRNRRDDPDYDCRHVCIEPYENPWLEQLPVEVLRCPVEQVEVSFFNQLSAGDILFIDSSHVIRPGGDVLFEYLTLLPTLNEGVLVHMHDIFTPRDYFESWVCDHIKFWNEQYLLEAFLTENDRWHVVAALDFLNRHHREALLKKCPHLAAGGSPGSFYIQKRLTDQ